MLIRLRFKNKEVQKSEKQKKNNETIKKKVLQTKNNTTKNFQISWSSRLLPKEKPKTEGADIWITEIKLNKTKAHTITDKKKETEKIVENDWKIKRPKINKKTH